MLNSSLNDTSQYLRPSPRKENALCVVKQMETSAMEAKEQTGPTAKTIAWQVRKMIIYGKV